jgi:putative transposase
MNFEPGYLYHIYNQGNNRREIFFSRENYLYFIRKIQTHVLPYAEVVAWCLMPNHFHLMVEVRRIVRQGLTPSQTLTNNLNQSIGVMLRSYTRAINKQEDFTGSLFRKETKAECVNCPHGVAPNFFMNRGVTELNIKSPNHQYPQVCFDYIHQNPVKANLVTHSIDWEFSSAASYYSNKGDVLVNKKLAIEYGLI